MVWVGLFNDFISWAIFVVKTQVIAEKKPCLALGIYLFFLLSPSMYYLPNTYTERYILHSTELILYWKGV